MLLQSLSTSTSHAMGNESPSTSRKPSIRRLLTQLRTRSTTVSRSHTRTWSLGPKVTKSSADDDSVTNIRILPVDTPSTVQSDTFFENSIPEAAPSRGLVALRQADFRPFDFEADWNVSDARSAFVDAHQEWNLTTSLDEMRQSEFARLDAGDGPNAAYLDYTGAGLYPSSIVANHVALLTKTVLGNPHSVNPTSQQSSSYQNAARAAILSFFDASPDIYSVVFTANASACLKLVGESYPFTSSTELVLQVDAHNAVNGCREFARSKGAKVVYVGGDVKRGLSEGELAAATSSSAGGLAVLTGQSNLTGQKLDLDIIAGCRQRGFDIFLDAAALAPTSPISLAQLDNSVSAMGVSLYKMVGYPTGVGALVVRKDFLSKLRRPWFCGGTVKMVQVPGDGVILEDDFERFEDGTPNFLSFSPIPDALAFLGKHQPALSIRLPLLMHFLITALGSLKHPNGVSLANISFPSPVYDPATHGAVLSLNFVDESGKQIRYDVVDLAASAAGLSVRSACVCNHGAALAHLPVASANLRRDGTVAEWLEELGAQEMPGYVRVSFGLASNFDDAWAFVQFARTFLGSGADDMRDKYTAIAEVQRLRKTG